MLDALADRAWRRPWVLLAVAAVVLAGSLALAIDAPDRLGIGSLRLTEVRADPAPAEAELVVVLDGRGVRRDSRLFRVGQDVVTARMKAAAAIDSVRAVERKNGSVALVARFGDASDAERQQAVIRLDDAIDPGALRATVGGEIHGLIEARRELEDELWRTELLVLPLALLIAGVAAGLRPAVAPVLCAAIAIAGSLALMRLIGTVADVSLLGFGAAAAVGLVLGVELALAMLRSPPSREPEDARRILTIAAVAALPALAGLATPLGQAASLALGCAIAALLAGAATVLVVPPVHALTLATDPPASSPRPGSRRLSAIGLALGIAGLCVLALPTVLYGTTAPDVALDAARALTPSPSPDRSVEDSLFGELPVAGAIAAALLALALAALARSPWGLALGPLSLLPAVAGVGICAFLAENGDLIGMNDPEGTWLDTGAVAVALSALAAIGGARSASVALAARDQLRVELTPAVAATAIGALAAAAMIATGVDLAEQLGVALIAGLILDLVLLRVPLWAVVDGRIGSGGD